jgi:hypothetical protein
MDLAPIGGIRIFSPETPLRADGAAARFEIGASTRAREEKYSSSRQWPDRRQEDGLESSLAEEGEAEESSASADEPDPGPTINIVA